MCFILFDIELSCQSRSLAQFIDALFIALFEFELTVSGVRIVAERHYRLVESSELGAAEIAAYQIRPD